MTLTQAQIRRIEYLLSQEGGKNTSLILSTVESFMSWLRSAATDLWNSIKGVIRQVWDDIVDFFTG